MLKLPVGRRFKFLLESNKLDDDNKEMYRELISLNKSQNPVICQMQEYMEIYDMMYERYKKFAELVHRTAWEPYTWYVRRYLQIKSNEFPLMKHLKRAIL